VEHAHWLRTHPLCAGIDDDGVWAAARLVMVRQLASGMAVFVEQMAGDSAFVIAAGEVSVLLHRNGSDHEVGVLTAPEVFGEQSLLYPQPRRVTTRAKTDAVLLELNRRELSTLATSHPKAFAQLLQNANDCFRRKAAEVVPVVEYRLDLANSQESARRGFFA
jgi:CRP/FNR family transcriptional regulator, cyclic AMP receptor protein